jgi:hypothetical protein
MSLPRQVPPGSDYVITLRCSERRFFRVAPTDGNPWLSFLRKHGRKVANFHPLGGAAARPIVTLP